MSQEPHITEPVMQRFARWFSGASLASSGLTEGELRDQLREIDGMRQRLMGAVDDRVVVFKQLAGARVPSMDHDPIAAAEFGAFMVAAQECCDVLTVARAEVMVGGGG